MRGQRAPGLGAGSRAGGCLPDLVVRLTSGRAWVVLETMGLWVVGMMVLGVLEMGGAGVELSSGESSQKSPT